MSFSISSPQTEPATPRTAAKLHFFLDSTTFSAKKITSHPQKTHSKHPKTPSNIPKHIQTSQTHSNIPKHIQTPENTFKHTKTLRRPKNSQTPENIQTSLKLSNAHTPKTHFKHPLSTQNSLPPPLPFPLHSSLFTPSQRFFFFAPSLLSSSLLPNDFLLRSFPLHSFPKDFLLRSRLHYFPYSPYPTFSLPYPYLLPLPLLHSPPLYIRPISPPYSYHVPSS